MKIIKYLLTLFILFSLTSQDEVVNEIKEKLFSNIKVILDKRGSYNYRNFILDPTNIETKKLIIDRVELNNEKINEIGKRYNLEPNAIDQIKAAFFASQPNIYKDFEFSLNSADLDQIIDKATFSEYIGCCFRQDNMINYMIFRLTVNTKIYSKQGVDEKFCLIPHPSIYHSHYTIDEVREACKASLYCFICRYNRFKFDAKRCPNEKYQWTTYKRRPLNNDEKAKAKELVLAYSAELFKIMIEEIHKKVIIPDEKIEVQSIFTTGQIFKNDSYNVQAEITSYGDIEIKGNCYELFSKKCLNITNISLPFIKRSNCRVSPSCDERKNEYLIADKDSGSGCVKLKELKKEKKNINLEIYINGSMAIKDTKSGGILFYAKPNIKGDGPFSVGVSKEYELQIIDSKKVVVWKSNPIYLHSN